MYSNHALFLFRDNMSEWVPLALQMFLLIVCGEAAALYQVQGRSMD